MPIFFNVSRTRRAVFLICTGIAVLTAYATVASFPTNKPTRLAPAPASTAIRPTPLLDDAADVAIPLKFQQFALNALLVPLMDDSLPRRWTDAALDFTCDNGTRVLIDGKPLIPGSLIPSGTFTVRWDIDHCEPFGPASYFSGGVDLFVSPTDDGMSAVVVPHNFQVHSALGRTRLRDTFTAELSLVTTITQP
ncbi:MAG: hypothetical protein V4731_10380 [Pseudomonadota bacterium]